MAAPAEASRLGASLEATLVALVRFLAQRTARAPVQANQQRHSLGAARSQTEDPIEDNRRAASALEPAVAARALPRCTRGRHRAVAARANPPGRAQQAARAQRQEVTDLLDFLQTRQAHLPAEEVYHLAYSRLLPFFVIR